MKGSHLVIDSDSYLVLLFPGVGEAGLVLLGVLEVRRAREIVAELGSGCREKILTSGTVFQGTPQEIFAAPPRHVAPPSSPIVPLVRTALPPSPYRGTAPSQGPKTCRFSTYDPAEALSVGLSIRELVGCVTGMVYVR